MVDNIVAKAPIQCVRKSGAMLPVFLVLSTKKIISPSAVITDVVFVATISGECRTGVNPQTTWYPTNTAKAKLVTKEIVSWYLVVKPNDNSTVDAILEI